MLHDVCSSCDCLAFLVPVDADLYGLEDYLDVIHHPMDLTTIYQRLCSGYYTASSSISSSSSSSSSAVALSTKPRYALGELVDVYCPLLEKWLEASVVDITHTDAAVTYKVQYAGWGAEGDVALREDDDRLLPHKSASLDKV